MLDSSVNVCSLSVLTLLLGSALRDHICPETCYSTSWCSNTNISFRWDLVAMTPKLSLGTDNRCLPLTTNFFFCSFSLPHLSSRSCNAPFVHGSVTLVGSRCSGLEYTPTSALLCSRGGILAPTGCPWDNWHRTSCYWPLFFLVQRWLLWSLSLWKKMIMFSCFVCAQPWPCHVTSHFNPHWLSCQQYI